MTRGELTRIGSLFLALVALLLLGSPATGVARLTPGSVQSFTFGSGLSAHSYLVYTPAGYRPGARLPLLVMVHGCQTTAYQQMKANLYNPLADQRHFVVVYPDTDPVEAAQPGPLQNCWQYFNPADWQRAQGDGAAVAAITRSVMTGWNIDPQRVYLMGMSSGAFLAADMAATYSDLYAAVGENAGADYEDFECTFQSTVTPAVTTTAQDAFTAMGPRTRVVPKIVIGGDADQGIPPACADRALEQSLRTNNLVLDHDHDQTKPIHLAPATVQPETKPGGYRYTISTYLDGHGCVIGQRYLVHGMNHFWSGGSSDPMWKNWTDPKGPSAAVASWSFFSRYTLANTAWSCAPPKPARQPARAHRKLCRRLHHSQPTGRGRTGRGDQLNPGVVGRFSVDSGFLAGERSTADTGAARSDRFWASQRSARSSARSRSQRSPSWPACVSACSSCRGSFCSPPRDSTATAS